MHKFSTKRHGQQAAHTLLAAMHAPCAVPRSLAPCPVPGGCLGPTRCPAACPARPAPAAEWKRGKWQQALCHAGEVGAGAGRRCAAGARGRRQKQALIARLLPNRPGDGCPSWQHATQHLEPAGPAGRPQGSSLAGARVERELHCTAPASPCRRPRRAAPASARKGPACPARGCPPQHARRTPLGWRWMHPAARLRIMGRAGCSRWQRRAMRLARLAGGPGTMGGQLLVGWCGRPGCGSAAGPAAAAAAVEGGHAEQGSSSSRRTCQPGQLGHQAALQVACEELGRVHQPAGAGRMRRCWWGGTWGQQRRPAGAGRCAPLRGGRAGRWAGGQAGMHMKRRNE